MMRRRISMKDRFPLDATVTATGVTLEVDEGVATVHTWARSHTSTSHDKVRLTQDDFQATWSKAANLGLLSLESPELGEEEGLRATRLEVEWEEGERALEGWDLRDAPGYGALIELLEGLAPDSMERVLLAVEPGDPSDEI